MMRAAKGGGPATIRQVRDNKKALLPLLLLADEQEDMIGRYLDRGELFVLEDGGAVIAQCVVTREGEGVYEVKSLSVTPERQRQGCGRRLLDFAFSHYPDLRLLLVGTGDVPSSLGFYTRCGFTPSHRVKNFFTDHYDHPMFEDGRQLTDMVYLKRERGAVAIKTTAMLEYLAALAENNDRDWYRDHRAQRLAAQAEFAALVRALQLRIGEFDPAVLGHEAGSLTFKLERDTRFSRDKSPYIPAFRAHIGPGGKLPVPVGYYLLLRPGDRSFLGGGLFADVFRDATAQVRGYIAQNGAAWDAVVNAPDFQKNFTVKGTALKKVPVGYDPESPQAAYLKMKSWYLERPVTDGELSDGEAFLRRATQLYRAMKPFNDCLDRALAGFTLPTR